MVLDQCRGTQDPVSYMTDVWLKKVEDVVERSAKKFNCGTEFRPEQLAHQCLSESRGDVEKALALFDEKWTEKVWKFRCFAFDTRLAQTHLPSIWVQFLMERQLT